MFACANNNGCKLNWNAAFKTCLERQRTHNVVIVMLFVIGIMAGDI